MKVNMMMNIIKWLVSILVGVIAVSLLIGVGFLIVVAGPIIAIFIGAIISFVVVAYLVKEYLDETARAKQRKKKSTPPPQ